MGDRVVGGKVVGGDVIGATEGGGDGDSIADTLPDLPPLALPDLVGKALAALVPLDDLPSL